MRLDRFDLNLLVVLDALLEARNVTRASERLHLGQSATSGALARLREYFGDELLVPVGRRMVLTPLAESLVAPVRDTVLRARATLALKPGFDPATAERRFTVCASDYVTTVLLAAVVRRIAAEAPGLALEIMHPPKGVEESFERGGIDLLVMPRQFLAQHSHPRAELFQDSHACLVWQGNTAVGQALTLERYMAMQHVAARLGDERSVSFEDWLLQRFGQKRRIAVTYDGFAMLPLLLVGTQRIATLHRRLAEHCAAQLPLRLLDTPFEMPPLVEVMRWHRHMDGDPAHAWLRRVLLECAAAMAHGATPME